MQQLQTQTVGRRRLCPLCCTPGHYSKTCSLYVGAKVPNRTRHCGICGEAGHDRRKCEWTLLELEPVTSCRFIAPEETDNTDTNRLEPGDLVLEAVEPLETMLVADQEPVGNCEGDSFMTCDSFLSCVATPGPTSLNSWDSSTESEILKSHRRTSFRVATLNVNTLMKAGQRHLLRKDMERLDLDVLCIQETRLKENGVHALGEGGSYLLYLGAADPRGYSGVGIIISSHLQIFHTEICSERLMAMGLRHMNKDILLFSCYAPTNTDDLARKEAFWDLLESKIAELRGRFTDAELIVAGDFNAEIGKDRLGASLQIGPHVDAEVTTDNGNALLELCASQNLFVENSRNRAPIHRRYTFRGFSGVRRATLDYVLVSRKLHDKWIRSKVRTTLVDTDHRCFILEMDLGLIVKKSWRRRRYKISQGLKGELKLRFNSCVKNSLLNNQREDHCDNFLILQSAINSAMQEIALSPYRPRNEWISDQSMLLCHVRRQASSFGIQGEALVELNRKCRQSIRYDKREWLRIVGEKIRKASSFNNMREVYDNINRLSGKKRGIGFVGDPVLLAHHFRNLGGPPLAKQSGKLVQTSTVEPVTVSEIQRQLPTFRNGRLPGPDGIPAEIWASLDDFNLGHLAGTMTSWIRQGSEIPSSLRQAEVIPLHKKGPHHDPSSFRGISLLQVAFKLYEKIIAQRLEQQLEKVYSESQSGFRKQRSTMDNIFTIHRLCEAAYEHNIPITIALLDFNAAFDSLNLERCWQLFSDAGINGSLLEALRELYHVILCRTGEHTFERTRGVPQGSILGPKIFTAALQLALGHPDFPDIMQLFYADDSAAMAWGDSSQMQQYLDWFVDRTSKIDLRLNPNKITVLTTEHNPIPLYLNGTTLATANHAKYLGVELEKSGCHRREIGKRVSAARISFLRMISFFKRRDISVKLKMNVYSSSVRAVLLYGAGSWRLTKSEFRKLDATDRSMRRKIVNGWRFLPDGGIRCISNRKLAKICQIPELSQVIRQARLRWIGHVARMEDSRPPKMAIDRLIEVSAKKRRKGGARKSYLGIIKEDLNFPAWNPRQLIRYIYRKAKDRDLWKHIIK